MILNNPVNMLYSNNRTAFLYSMYEYDAEFG